MRAILITPFLTRPIRSCVTPTEGDLILCADIAYESALREQITPHLIIGDFDHGAMSAPPPAAELLRVPAEKDDTDTLLCLKAALARGADEIVIVGGIGGRLDHTVANLQALSFAAAKGARAILTDGQNEARILTPGHYVFPKREHCYISLFAVAGEARGVTLRGFRYSLSGGTLTPDFPLGVSNETEEDFAEISFETGKILLIVAEKE